MKIHALAACMELTAQILRELPDGELPETLEHLLKLVQKSKSQQGDRLRAPVDVQPLSQETINRLTTISCCAREYDCKAFRGPPDGFHNTRKSNER